MKNCKPYHKPKNANTEAATARTIPPSLLHPVEKNNPNITTLTAILKVREIK